MSLYIGNLSTRTRRDELERVFRRFGRCNVQLKKDGYGFIVFDYPSDAEKALRALQGKNICGEPLTLTWSNKQPRPFQKFARAAGSYESQRGRNAARGGDHDGRKMGSNGWRDYKMRIKQPDSDGGRLDYADTLENEAGGCHGPQENIQDYFEEEHQGLHDEGGSVVADLVDNDRWGGQVLGTSNGNGIENGIGFDRYEPYRGYDGKDEIENQRIGYTGGSPVPRNSQESLGRDQIGDAALNHPNDSKPWPTCYSCGASGHKKRDCPKENALRRKSTKFDLRQNDDMRKNGRGRGEMDRFGSKSWGNHRSSRDTISARQLRDDRRASGSKDHWRLIKSRSSPVTKETDRDRRVDNGGKKRRRGIGSPKRSTAKKVRKSISSPHHSDDTASRSRSTSQSSKSLPKSRFHSRLRSTNSRARSLSCNSRSSSKSPYSGTRSIKSRSRSSSSTSLSLSVSLGQPLPSTPNKAQLNSKDSLCNATTPKSTDIPVERLQPIDLNTGLDSADFENTTMVVNNENVLSSSKVEVDMEKNQTLERDDYGNHITSGSLYEVTNPSTPMTEKGALTAGSSPPEILGGTVKLKNSSALQMELMPAKPDTETFAKSQTGCSTSISSEEMYMVLKHYGLEPPEENEGHLSIEAYFGSARFWPWDVIYYRRMKKGLISIENYDRRVAQNKEFGIVDKYIRSSSGWGEMDKDNL